MKDLYEYLRTIETSDRDINQKLIKILKGYDHNSETSLETYLLQELEKLQSYRPHQFIANLVKGGLLGCIIAVILINTRLDGIIRSRLPDLNFIKTHLIPHK